MLKEKVRNGSGEGTQYFCATVIKLVVGRSLVPSRLHHVFLRRIYNYIIYIIEGSSSGYVYVQKADSNVSLFFSLL